MRCKASKRRFYLTVYVEVPLVFFDLPAILQNDGKRGLARSGAIALASPPAIQFRARTGKAISIRPPFLPTSALLRSHAMTVAYLPVRGIPLRAISRFATAPSSIYSSIRVSHDQNAKQPTPASSLYTRNGPSSLIQGRNYASGPPKSIPGRPKAHTGRSPPSKRRTASASTTTIAKPAPRTTIRATGTKKPASRPRATRKAKPKAKAKPKPKKKELTEAQVERKKRADALVKRRTLREAALLTPKTSPPKQLPSTAFQVLLVERSGKGVGIIENSKAISASYKTLAPEARERANHIANENKAKNEAAYKRWLSTYSPMQIKEANSARLSLRREAKATGKKAQFNHIKDDRLVKQPINSYAFFLKDRIASGDMTAMQIGEVGKLVAREWKGLSAADKKQYDDLASGDRNRYVAEFKTVYGKDPEIATRTPKKSS